MITRDKNGIQRVQDINTNNQVQKLLGISSNWYDDALRAESLRPEAQFSLAYIACLNLARAVLAYAHSTSPVADHHKDIWEQTKRVLGDNSLLNYLSDSRKQRNRANYWTPDCVSRTEAKELIKEVECFDYLVRSGLRAKQSC